jgi:hypothetical protein
MTCLGLLRRRRRWLRMNDVGFDAPAVYGHVFYDAQLV